MDNNHISNLERQNARNALNDMWASLVFVRAHRAIAYKDDSDKERVRCAPVGYVLVIDRKFGPQAQWKLPGGHRRNDETPRQTAIRELEGETGISLSPNSLRYVRAWPDGRRGDHSRFLYVADIDEKDRELGWMGNTHPENEGEEPKFFTVEEFYDAVRSGMVLADHYRRLVEFALILPFGRDAAA